jgi:hypothetical protein
MPMPGGAGPAAVIAAASPAAASLNGTAAEVPARLRPLAAAALTGRPAGTWALRCGDDGR